ncbi:MAG: DUF3576 domain-containing protein [Roseococcus sp.]|jgi:hypothetical protein
MRRTARIALALSATALLAACGGGRLVGNEEYGTDNQREMILRQTGRNPSDAGIVIFGVDRSRQQEQASGGAGMAVNAFLWRATLDTLSFMPLASADPFGGVIITDWYSPPGAPGERFKATAYVLSRQLRSDGVRVQVFRQVLRGNQWVDAPASAATNAELEDRVLARARELRTQSAGR